VIGLRNSAIDPVDPTALGQRQNDLTSSANASAIIPSFSGYQLLAASGEGSCSQPGRGRTLCFPALPEKDGHQVCMCAADKSTGHAMRVRYSIQHNGHQYASQRSFSRVRMPIGGMAHSLVPGAAEFERTRRWIDSSRITTLE